MKVLMLMNARGSENGYEVLSFTKGCQYDLVSQSLANHFVQTGVAKLVTENESNCVPSEVQTVKKGKKKPAGIEGKALDGSDYQNKSAT